MAEAYQQKKRIRLYQAGPFPFPNINTSNQSQPNQSTSNQERNNNQKINELYLKILSVHNELKIMDSKLNYIGTTTNCIVNKIKTLKIKQDQITHNIEIMTNKIDKVQETIDKIFDKMYDNIDYSTETIKLNKNSKIPDDMMNSYYG